MSDEIAKSATADDGSNVTNVTKDVSVKDEAKTDADAKETKPRSVSFNRDVHVKRFGKPRESRGTSSDLPSIRKEPFTHLSEKELIDEANRVLAQAQSVTCTADHPPEKFFSLPHRKKLKEDKSARRNSDDSSTPEAKRKSNLGRSTSDVTSKRKRERTSLSTLFRRAQRTKSPDTTPVAVRPVAIVKRSKSDVTDLKSKQTNTLTGAQPKPKRKRSGSESEEFLKSLRNTKTQLSPIIESSPREDYFQKISPLDLLQKHNPINEDKTKVIDSNKVNPVEKPPRYKTPEKSEPKAPLRSKRGKSTDKEKSPSITETPKRITEIKKKVLVDEINSGKIQEKSLDVKDKIKDKIRKIEENVYGTKDMIHSSQQPPDKPPLTRGHTVDHIVRILKEDQKTQPVNPHLISPSTGTNINQPFSYTRPSTSPDPNLFVRNTSPDRVPTPVNKMDKGVVYAQVVRDRSNGTSKFSKENIHKTYSPPKEKYGNLSDEDEGLGYEERYKYSPENKYTYDYKNNGIENFDSLEGYKITDSPIKPKFREYKLTSFKDFEPTYANEYPTKEDPSQDYIDGCRGRADGMDTKKKHFEAEVPKVDLDFNELSHRRELLESRLNARRIGRERNVGEPISRYLAETDPIYEAQKRMKATEKYVNEITSKYYSHTLERDGFTESTVTESYNKYDSDNNNIKYNTETRTSHKTPKGEVDRREFIDHLEVKPRYTEDGKIFPPEPEYEPPSLEFNTGKPILSPDEYKEKKYKAKKNFISSHEVLQTGQKYKVKDTWFGKRKGHYASNPEIAQEREDDIYANVPYHSKQPESYHNSLRRKSKERRYKDDYGIRRHDSGDSRDYYRETMSPRRFETDNRLVDSGIENDFRKESNGDIRRSKHRRHDSYEDARDTSLFLDSERRHTEDNHPSEQIYANGGDMARFDDYRHDVRKDYIPRDKSADDGSHHDPKIDRYEKSPNGRNEKINAKPPKAKKLSGLEKMKQLFSRDSSKKSKKEDAVQPKTRTRVLKSPEHLAMDDHEYKRFTDPEPSDIEVVKKVYEPKEDRRYRNSREELDVQRSSDPRDIDPERKYRDGDYDGRYERTVKEVRRHVDRKEEKRRYHSSDRESDHQSTRPSDVESDLRKSRSRTARPLDSPTLAERYRGRRRLATPSPSPSPPLRKPAPASSGGWFKSLDRLGRKREKSLKTDKESIITTDNESIRKTKPLNSPAKNLRFFGDTDQDSDATVKQTITKTKSHPQPKSRGTVRKTLSNSSTGIDEVDHSELSGKSYSLSNLHREGKSDSPKTKQYYKRNLHNISEIQSNSETESHAGRKVQMKPPISPYDRRSRSQSSSKTLKGKSDVRRPRTDDRGSSSELRSSKQELSRDSKARRRTPVTNSGESSTEGDSSHQSQRSVVYLHATTVGDIPDPGRVSRNRSRDDVSSVNSSNLQIKSTTKSFSIFAPWTPKHYSEQHDVHYAQKPRKAKETSFIKPSRNAADERPSTLQKNRSYSQTTLNRRPVKSRLTSSSTTLYRKPEKRENSAAPSTLSRRTMARDAKRSQSNEVLSRNDDKVSRSISMPKDNNKKAGWFKLSNKNKKSEIDTRVR